MVMMVVMVVMVVVPAVARHDHYIAISIGRIPIARIESVVVVVMMMMIIVLNQLDVGF